MQNIEGGREKEKKTTYEGRKAEGKRGKVVGIPRYQKGYRERGEKRERGERGEEPCAD